MSRLWVIYLGFVTGMILALVGAAFILGKLREEQSEVTGKTAAGEWALKSASPGLVMTVLGVVLMITTILTPQAGSVSEGPLYLHNPNLTVPVGGSSGSKPSVSPSSAEAALWKSLSAGTNPATAGDSKNVAK